MFQVEMKGAVLAEAARVLLGGIVVCGKGTFLEIVSLKPEGKNEMKMADFLNGNSGFVGSVLK
jgi:methionyl-tRNA formyltransferase